MEHENVHKFFIVVVFLFIFSKVVRGQACTKDTTVGEKDTEDETDNDLSGSGINAVLMVHNDFKFDCCGYIERWEIYARSGVTVPIDVTTQVWEDNGSLWDLVGENIITATESDKENQQTITNGNRIRVAKDQYIGFYEHAGSVITYGDGQTFKETTFGTPQTSFDWDSIPNSGWAGRDFAIHARVVQSVAPIFTNLDDTVTIQSTASAGTVLFTLIFSDADIEDAGLLTVTQTGTTGSAATFFQYNTLTYEISIQAGASLTPGDHTMTFTVTDVCGVSSTGTLTVRISNEPPVITSLPDDTTISEDLDIKTLLHSLVTTDVDGHTVTCSLSSSGVPFTVEVIAGSSDFGIYFDASSTMDYYTQNAYVLTVTCTDGVDSVTGEFTVNLILNQAPKINGLPIAVDISEDTNVVTTLYTLSVTDPENVAVECTLTSITPTSTFFYEKPSANFNEIDIMLASGAPLDYDLVRLYRLDISCTDGRRSDTNVFFVNLLRNQPPVFVNLQNVTSVSSLGSRIGQIIFDVEIRDPTNDQVQYSMSCVPSTNCPFEIYDSGTILLTRSLEGDFVPAYDLYVYVTDGKTTVGPRSLTVHILDINYVPVITNLPLPSALVVSENTASGTSVYQVSIQDRDKADTHLYYMTSIPSTGMLYFEIDSTIGLVKTSSTNDINYEVILPTTSFTFTVTVTDTKDSVTNNLTIDIADVNEPVIFTKTSYILTTDEGPAGTILTDPGYLYTDEDTSDTHRFSLVCDSTAGYFSIVPSTGRISVTSDLDIDGTGLPTSFTCTVTITDGTMADAASLTINVNNINDNTPVFSSNLYTYYLDINTGVNTVFGSTVATDLDKGSYGTFTYSIDQTSLGTEIFGIQLNGDLYLKSSLTSFGYGHSLKFQVLATDTGSLQGSATVYVVIPQTTTSTSTSTDRPIKFLEYPPNLAWLVVAAFMGLISIFLPCYMIYKHWGTCTWKGRPGQSIEDTMKEKPTDNKPRNGQVGAGWNPWKWYQVHHR